MPNLKFAVALAALFLASCVNAPSQPERLDFSRTASKGQVGWVTLTATRSGRYSVAPITYHFRSLDSSVLGKFDQQINKLDPNSPSIPIPVPNGYIVKREHSLGGLVTIALPAGKYQIHQYEGEFSPTGGQGIISITHKYRSNPDFRIDFDVVAGQVVYLGNLHLLFGERGISFELNNERARDTALFRAANPDLATVPLVP